MRSLAEIRFRLRQEIGNLLLWMVPPKLPRPPQAPKLKDPSASVEQLRSCPFAADVLRLAEEIVAHRFPVFGEQIDTGKQIRWRRDYVHGLETGTPYFRRVPYLDFMRVGDHKYIWELNRHQHLVLLAQAYLFTRSQTFLDEIQAQIQSWLTANPYLCGINWTSALEVAFRALSWVWVDHLVGQWLPRDFRDSWMTELYRHGCYLELNLSVYFSPNTHLLGEAVVLHTLGSAYPDFPGSARWQKLGHDLVEEQMRRQVHADGAHFEQSTYYHVYALDFFLWHALLADTSPEYQDKLRRMAEYLHALLGPAGRLPLIGDDDGGRLFHPYGERDAFGRATLATSATHFAQPAWIRSASDLAEQAAWWMPDSIADSIPSPHLPASQWFSDTGVAVMAAGDVHIVIKAGGFGPSTAGHSHSDVLSFVCRRGPDEILIDPGTYMYLDDTGWRNRFRGSAAHNTIRIQGLDQAIPRGPFRWEAPPIVMVSEWGSTNERDWLDAECAYAGFLHRRQFLFLKPGLLLVVDTVNGPAGEHLVEQFWHFGPDTKWLELLALSSAAESAVDWRSPVYGTKEEHLVRRVLCPGLLPIRIAAALSLDNPIEVFRFEENTIHLGLRRRPILSIRLSDCFHK